VLVVEDDAATRRMLVEAIAEEGGYPVVIARDGQEALERAQATRPGLVLLDIQLPRMDGREVARRLKADRATAGAWIIAVSAHGHLMEALGAGCDQFLWKPLRVDELLVAVAAGLARAGPAAELPPKASAPREDRA
jgi:chemosensory pili system protein ChpA (sensor histidine kinase/response regulator)